MAPSDYNTAKHSITLQAQTYAPLCAVLSEIQVRICWESVALVPSIQTCKVRVYSQQLAEFQFSAKQWADKEHTKRRETWISFPATKLHPSRKHQGKYNDDSVIYISINFWNETGTKRGKLDRLFWEESLLVFFFFRRHFWTQCFSNVHITFDTVSYHHQRS